VVRRSPPWMKKVTVGTTVPRCSRARTMATLHLIDNQKPNLGVRRCAVSSRPVSKAHASEQNLRALLYFVLKPTRANPAAIATSLCLPSLKTTGCVLRDFSTATKPFAESSQQSASGNQCPKAQRRGFWNRTRVGRRGAERNTNSGKAGKGIFIC
jgi:hypothetical protein